MQTIIFDTLLLLHAADLLEAQLRQRLSPLGVGPRQARILDALPRMQPTSQNDLAREFDVTPASMSTMTTRLISAGLISRESDPAEARRNLLRLSEKGESLLQEIHAVWKEMDGFVGEQIGRKDAETLARLARTLRNQLGGKTPGADAASERRASSSKGEEM